MSKLCTFVYIIISLRYYLIYSSFYFSFPTNLPSPPFFKTIDLLKKSFSSRFRASTFWQLLLMGNIYCSIISDNYKTDLKVFWCWLFLGENCEDSGPEVKKCVSFWTTKRNKTSCNGSLLIFKELVWTSQLKSLSSQ